MGQTNKRSPLNDRLDAGYIVAENGCWLWQRGCNSKGYGTIGHEGKKILVHRAMYERYKGPLKNNGLHECDTTTCCNPDHIIDGTQKKNMEDCKLRRRNNSGERNGSAKLTDATAELIRVATGTQKQIAKEFGVHQTTVCAIKAGKRGGNNK